MPVAIWPGRASVHPELTPEQQEAQHIKELDRAQKARNLLEDEYVDSIIRKMKVEAENEFLSASDHLSFLKAQAKYKVLADFVHSLTVDIQTGEMAKTQLQKLREFFGRKAA